MLWIITIVLLIIWGGGFALHIAGGLIHILLILVLISVVYNLFAGRRV